MTVRGKRAELNLLEDYCDLTEEEKQKVINLLADQPIVYYTTAEEMQKALERSSRKEAHE